jgi:glycosyltransferase involved in cell wall biosynthesis
VDANLRLEDGVSEGNRTPSHARGWRRRGSPYLSAQAHVTTSDDPLVSVIVPVRDGERFLERTLRSALDQTFRALEVIVVDDHSTDRTGEIATRLADADGRLRYVEATGSGVAAARNTGLELARGEFIAPLDADDLWMRTKLEEQTARLDRAGPDVALVYSWALLIDAEDSVIGVNRPFDFDTMRSIEGDVLLPLVYKCFFTNSTVLVRRDRALEVGGYDGSLSRREDWDFALRLAERWPFALVPDFLVAYRQLEHSRSHGEQELLRSQRRILERVVSATPDVPRSVVRWSWSECYAFAAARSAGAHRFWPAIRLQCRAVLLDPGQLLRPGPWHAAAAAVRRALTQGRGGGQFLDVADNTAASALANRRRPRLSPFAWMERRRIRRLRALRVRD